MNSRHELLWLTAAGWRALMAQGADPADLGRWREADWPVVVRRNEPGVPVDAISIGLPLPPTSAGSKRRFGGHIGPADVARRQPPLTLMQVLPCAPARWHDALDALLAETVSDAPPLRIFGSLAMQALTGLAYLTDASDLDLLLQPRTVAQLDAALLLLQRYRQHLPLDGEIVFPHGAAVSWKEWLGAPDGGNERVLVKTIDGVALAPKVALLATLARP